MPSVKDFRVLLFQLGEKLSEHDIEGIVSIEDLPAELHGQSGLKILLKLEMMGRISVAKLQSLEEVFRNVGRVDLAKKVKEFSKSQKRGCKRNATAVTIEEQQRTLSANLEVTVVQMRLLLDQLKHLHQTAQATGPKSVENIVAEAQEDAEQLEKKLFYAKTHLEDDSSPASDESISPPVSLRQKNSFELELEQHLAKSRKSPPKAAADLPNRTTADQIAPAETTKLVSQEESEENMYAEVVHQLHPNLIGKSADGSACFESTTPRLSDQDKGREGSSAMVTGALRKPDARNRKKPMPPPKPAKFPKTSTIAEDDEDEGNYTGSCTGGTTGESGFSDAGQFLKVDLTNTPEHQAVPVSYYKSLRREEVGDPSYYKLTDRESQTKMLHELMKNEPTKSEKDEGIYENCPSTSHTF